MLFERFINKGDDKLWMVVVFGCGELREEFDVPNFVPNVPKL